MIKRLISIFLQGLIAIMPLAVTVFIILWMVSAAERTFSVAVNWILPDRWYTPGMGVACGVALVFGIGLLVNIWGVPRLIHLAESFIAQIPLVKTIYGAVRDLLGFFSKSGGLGDGKVVMVSIGSTDMRAIGLLTRDSMDDPQLGLRGKGYVAVYLPMSYQIGGFTVFVPRERVELLDMRIEDALRFIVTAGAKSPTSTMSSNSAPDE